MILAAAIAVAVVTFPYSDVGAAIQKPSPASFLRVAADVATSVIPFEPQARIAVVGLNVMAVMVKHPARYPMREAQTFQHRGGRNA